MNWTTLLRFRKQVEDMAREAVVLAEWEKSQERAAVDQIYKEMDLIAQDIGNVLLEGTDSLLAKERYLWLEALGQRLERHLQTIQGLDAQLVELRQKLKKAYQSRRVVEIVIAKKENEVLMVLARQEQRIHDEMTAHAYTVRSHEEIA